MNTELLNQLNDHFNKTLHVGEYGTSEYIATGSTLTDFGSDDDITIPVGTYFYAYSDEAKGLPLPMMCLPLQKEMYEEGFSDSHQVLVWKL